MGIMQALALICGLLACLRAPRYAMAVGEEIYYGMEMEQSEVISRYSQCLDTGERPIRTAKSMAIGIWLVVLLIGNILRSLTSL